MNVIMVLYPSHQQNDAEHAKGVLQEELKTYHIESMEIGKELLQTNQTKFVFRDVENPVVQNMFKDVKKIYISKEISENDEWLRSYVCTEKIEIMTKPTSCIIDYVGEVESEKPKEVIEGFVLEDDKVKFKPVEVYKAERVRLYETKEEAEEVLEKMKQKEEVEKVEVKKVVPNARRKKEKIEMT